MTKAVQALPEVLLEVSAALRATNACFLPACAFYDCVDTAKAQQERDSCK